ncbi:MAG: DNA primase [Treponema sp.]|nr:DNA primase [Treponema sp.]
MARIAKSTAAELHQRMDAIAVVEDYIRLEKRSNGQYWGRCPFHANGQERTPSFKVDPEKKLYYCFGCQKGGSVIDFVMEMDKSGYQDAVKNLARKFGVDIVFDRGTPSGSGGEWDNKKYEAEQSRRGELNELYRRTAVTFNHFLMKKAEGKPALDYLFSRKINAEMIERFRLGYSPADRNWLYTFLQSKSYSAEFLDNSGLFSANYRGMAFFFDRLMFPIADRHGHIVAFGGRAMKNEGKDIAKYINSRENEMYVKKQVLFALDLALPEIRRTKTFYLVEGYMDAIALHQAGITNALAPCGTAFTDEQAKLMRHWAEKAVLVFDSDAAGQAAAMKSIITCRKNGLACYLVVPDANNREQLKDPAEILEKFGENTLKNILNCAIIDFEYLIIRAKSLHDISTPKGKSEAIALFFPYLDILISKTESDDCIGLIADEMRSERRVILEEYERWKRSVGSASEKPSNKEVPNTERSIQMRDELFLLTLVSVNMDLYPEFRASLEIRDIENPDAKELFIALEECFIHRESGRDALFSRIDSERLRNFVIARGMSPEFTSNTARSSTASDPKKMMEDGIKRVKVNKLRRRCSEIGAELRLLERNSGIGAGGINARSILPEDTIRELIAEKMYLDAEIRKLEGK